MRLNDIAAGATVGFVGDCAGVLLPLGIQRNVVIPRDGFSSGVCVAGAVSFGVPAGEGITGASECVCCFQCGCGACTVRLYNIRSCSAVCLVGNGAGVLLPLGIQRNVIIPRNGFTGCISVARAVSFGVPASESIALASEGVRCFQCCI